MFILDTNICIYLLNQRNPRLRDRFRRRAPEIRISAITYVELCYGVAHSAPREHNARELDAFFGSTSTSCLSITVRGLATAEVRHALVQSGRPIGANDLLIAAHASSRGSTVVTNDDRAFRHVPDLRVENWVRG